MSDRRDAYSSRVAQLFLYLGLGGQLGLCLSCAKGTVHDEFVGFTPSGGLEASDTREESEHEVGGVSTHGSGSTGNSSAGTTSAGNDDQGEASGQAVAGGDELSEASEATNDNNGVESDSADDAGDAGEQGDTADSESSSSSSSSSDSEEDADSDATVSTETTESTESSSTTDSGDSDGTQACRGIDLLFVVDTRSYADDHHDAMIKAMPDLFSGLHANLPDGVNVRMGLTTTEMGNAGSAAGINCESAQSDQYYITIEDGHTGRPGSQGRMLSYQAQSRTDFDSEDGVGASVASLNWINGLLGSLVKGSMAPMPAAAAGWAADPRNDATNDNFIRDDDTVFALFVAMSSTDDYTPNGVGGEFLFEKIADRKRNCGGGDCMIGAGVFREACFGQDPIGELMGLMGEPPIIGSQTAVVGDDPTEYRRVFAEFARGMARLCRDLP